MKRYRLLEELRTRRLRVMWPIVKRFIDIVVAVLLWIAVAPILLIIIPLIKYEGPGPVFYKDLRVGRGGKPFKLVKFRTMSFTAIDEAIYATNYVRKLHDDPRITRIGRFLRQTSLDEVPQLMNVILGDMSLVGPRAAFPFEVERYSDAERRRLDVRPGITGYWQVYGRAISRGDKDSSFNRMIDMDVEYVDRQSLLLDLQIILRTIMLVLMRDAY